MKKGVNLIGYARAEFGLGEACRLAAKSLHEASIPFCIINFPHCPARQNDFSWRYLEVDEPIYNTNIFFINGDQLLYHFRMKNIKKSWFQNRYNIGYWHWELLEFPDSWNECFQLVDEIWVPSSFTWKAISKRTKKPVIIIPHAVQLDKPTNPSRTSFGLPEDRFLFITMFDPRSTLARKNPQGTIDAFKSAFDKNDKSVALILKMNDNKNIRKEMSFLKQQCYGYENIIFMNEVLSRQKVNELLKLIDCYVSLHRSEGFGLPMAEAMFLEKPVIATNWSGNTDFMNSDNAFLVPFSLVKINKDHGPYKSDQLWAEPDIYRAAKIMKTMVSNKTLALTTGLQAQKTIQENFSPKRIGEKYKKRLLSMLQL